MSDHVKVNLKNQKKVQNSPENVSNNHDSSEEKTNVPSENSSTSNEQRGLKRSFEEDCVKSDLPQVLKDMFKPLYCELCNVSVSTPVVAYTHYEGKTHKKNINSYMKKHFNVENVCKVKKIFEPKECDVCNITLTSEIVYQQHLAGKQHKKNLRRSDNGSVIPVTQTEVDPTGRFGIGKAFLKENEQQSQSQSLPVQTPAIFCEICTVFTDTEQQMLIHKSGSKHAKNIAKRKIVEKSFLSRIKKPADFYNDDNVWQASVKDENKDLPE